MGSERTAWFHASAVLLVLATACGRFSYDGLDAGDAFTETVYASCAEVRDTRADAVDGVYLIAGGPDEAPTAAYCDLTRDGGGWMLVTHDMLVDEQALSVTVVKSDDARGGAVVRVYANVLGCGQPQDNVHIVAIADRPQWTQVRAHYRFAGGTSCWWIFGAVSPQDNAKINGSAIVPNLVPFEAGVDTLRDPVKMGGDAGDAFDGMTTRCDDDTTNFWHGDRGHVGRSATVILRRNVLPGSAGLATTTSCTDFAPGIASPTWWEYSDISVR